MIFGRLISSIKKHFKKTRKKTRKKKTSPKIKRKRFVKKKTVQGKRRTRKSSKPPETAGQRKSTTKKKKQTTSLSGRSKKIKKRKSSNSRKKQSINNKGALKRKITKKKKISGVAKEPQRKLAISGEKLIGEITHYFSKIKVCVIKMTAGTIALNDPLHIKGSSTDFRQKVGSLQIENSDVRIAKKEQLVGMKVKHKVRQGDQVFKIVS